MEFTAEATLGIRQQGEAERTPQRRGTIPGINAIEKAASSQGNKIPV